MLTSRIYYFSLNLKPYTQKRFFLEEKIVMRKLIPAKEKTRKKKRERKKMLHRRKGNKKVYLYKLLVSKLRSTSKLSTVFVYILNVLVSKNIPRMRKTVFPKIRSDRVDEKNTRRHSSCMGCVVHGNAS